MSQQAASTKVPSLIQKPPTGRKVAPPPAGPTEPVRFFRVDSPDARITRPQGDYVLRRGKEVRSDQYDVKLLMNRGVKLVEISTPGWYTEQQRAGREKALELRSAGHDVEVPAEFEPISVPETTAPAA